jgi:alkyl hydroperoxide reductase subunit AhpC
MSYDFPPNCYSLLPPTLQYFGDSWGLLFSHPNDYTPVCTTELGEAALRQSEFDRRGVKLIGLSCNSAEDHDGWCADIKALRGAAVSFLFCTCCRRTYVSSSLCMQPEFPIIADAKREIAALLGMLDEVRSY